MNNIEKRLTEEKQRLDMVTAPPELEARLRNALQKRATSKAVWRRQLWQLAAVALMFVLIIGYNYHALAFYGKKFLGFDDLLYGTLKDLNEQGMGQIIDKDVELADGTVLTIEGLMTDPNQLVLYYSLTNPKGLNEESTLLFRPSKITGFLTDSYIESGMSMFNEEETELKGTYFFEPVSPFSKKLTLHFHQSFPDQSIKEERITFPYDPNQAMKSVFKQSIKQKIRVDRGSITFDALTATPTMTMITGTLNVENVDRISGALGGVHLLANGQPIDQIGSGHRSALWGREFDIRYDVLPDQLDSLEIALKDFVGYQIIQEKIPLTSSGDASFMLGEQALWIKEVLKTPQTVEITIATDEDVLLDQVSILVGDKAIPLKTTVNQLETKLPDGRLVKQRTLLFDTPLEPDYLFVGGIHYRKAYEQVIEIPLN